jgi:hypothetical protein
VSLLLLDQGVNSQPRSLPSELGGSRDVVRALDSMENIMGLGKGALLWLIGIPIPIIILLMLFLR